MRGLLKASLLLAPLVATAFVVPRAQEHAKDSKEDLAIAHHSFALIGVQIPSSPDEWTEALALRLDVLPSEEACGLGNVTVNGQVLPQTLGDGITSGRGSITTNRRNLVIASWSFHCIKVNGQPDSQYLKFVIETVDGKPMKPNVGFSSVFRQTSSTEIVNIKTDFDLPDELAANPYPEGLRPTHPFPRLSSGQEMDELHLLRTQMRELQYLIWAKEQAIAEHVSANLKADIQNCDSLRCIAKAIVAKARKAAHQLFSQIHSYRGGGEPHDRQDERSSCLLDLNMPHGHLPKLPPGWPKHIQKEYHTCRPQKHSKNFNHGAPSPSPPPGPRHGSPKGDHILPPPPGPHGDFPHNGPPSRHGGPDHEIEAPHEGRQGPFHSDIKAHYRPSDRPHGPSNSNERPHNDRPGRHHRNGLRIAFHIIKYVVIGIVLSLLVISLHRRTCNPRRCADRQARREERHRRRAFRHAARKHTIIRFLSRFSGHEIGDENDDDEEGKRQALLASDAEEGNSTTMTEEITEFRNAADVVDDMVAESSRRAQFIVISSSPASKDRPLTCDCDIRTQVEGGEELPAYRDSDGSELSSVVTDGFRYTPGSTEHSSSYSPSPSVSDI